jgi:hypothetical protein
MLPPIAVEPGTCAQIFWTSVVGPPISVVPVSIADIAELPLAICTLFPWTVTPRQHYIMKFLLETCMLIHTSQFQKPKARCDATRHVHKFDVTRVQTSVCTSQRQNPPWLFGLCIVIADKPRQPDRHFWRTPLVVIRQCLPPGFSIRRGKRLECEAHNARNRASNNRFCHLLHIDCSVYMSTLVAK